ncbi:MAG: hypothetical protein M3Z21_04200 [Pseudomonadota bacterium]|nr:hypothetical protein [Pseudomonadota bacterium]
MLTYKEIRQLPRGDRALIRTSHDYFRALLSGAPQDKCRQLRRAWICEVQRRWPNALKEEK